MLEFSRPGPPGNCPEKKKKSKISRKSQFRIVKHNRFTKSVHVFLGGALGSQNWSKNSDQRLKSGEKRRNAGARADTKRRQGAILAPKWRQSGAKVTPKRRQSGTLARNWRHSDAKVAILGHVRAQNLQKPCSARAAFCARCVAAAGGLQRCTLL